MTQSGASSDVRDIRRGAVAIVPARGGSKRIPRKNVRAFAGQPMIGYAIAAARDSGLFERIVVSTDDAEIAEVARSHGAETPFVRPPELADDHAPTVPVIRHAIQALAGQGWHAGPVCCIYPAVPLLDPQDLRRALAMLEAGAREYVFPVAGYPSPVQRALQRDADGRTQPLYAEFTQTRTQDLAPAYFDAGQFYWADAATWCAGLSIHGHANTLVLPANRVVDIDTPDDWALAEALCRVLKER